MATDRDLREVTRLHRKFSRLANEALANEDWPDFYRYNRSAHRMEEAYYILTGRNDKLPT
jgi:hypothetical protein